MDESADHKETLEPEAGCASCASRSVEPVLAVGSITLRLPSLAVQREYEFERASLPKGGTEHSNLLTVIERRPDLARLVCWVFSIQNIERYYLQPRTDHELQTLINGVRLDEEGSAAGTHVVVGWIAGRHECGGLELPQVLVESSYHYALADFFDTIFDALGKDEKDRKAFRGRAREAFEALTGVSGNDGSGEFRALNWAAVRFAPLYDLVTRAAERDEVLRAVDVRPSGNATPDRSIVELLLAFEPRKFGPSSTYRLPIDLSDLFPYPVAPSFMQTFQS